MSEKYAWRGGTEMLLRHGEGATTTLLVLPALFEEANRMRRFAVSLMRRLAEAGIGTVLPDLPGTGESLADLADVTLDDWRDVVAGVAETLPKPLMTLAIRGGAILDGTADFGWRLAPESGERMLRDLVRATALSSGRSASEIDRAARARPTALAGQTLSPALYQALLLAPAIGANRRTVRLGEDPGPRDASLDGKRLWRGAEPGDDPDLADLAAADIVLWTKTCAAP
ncbi:MAG: hypothetical protein H0X36_12805 [Sphingomonadaceae bacterium]|nr:hypothetical protein [Sphingomonadaceae bacterium]